jgi:hypothetical protein
MKPNPQSKSAAELQRRANMLKRGMRCACGGKGVKFDGSSPVCERCSSLEAGSATRSRWSGQRNVKLGIEPYHVAL